MNASDKPLLVCDPHQKGGKSIALLFTETSEQSVLVFPSDSANPLQGFSTGVCQMKRIQAPVVRIGPPLHEPSLLQVVQDGHQTAGMNLQLGCKLLLAQSGCNA